jgi:hypothetical protein
MTDAECERDPVVRRLVVATLRVFGILFFVRIFGRWIMSDSVDTWVIWLRDDWTSELIVCGFAALIAATAGVFGMENNRYVDRP